MQFRSTNAKFVHFGGDIVSNVDDSSHGVKLSGGSTGGVVEPVGDETNIALTVRPKGSGPMQVGASGTITIGTSNGAIQMGGSTAPFAGFIRHTDTAIATPNFNTTNAMVVESSVTITGVNSSHFVLGKVVSNGVASTDFTVGDFRTTSTANEVLFTFTKHSTVTVAASTCQMNFLVIRF